MYVATPPIIGSLMSLNAIRDSRIAPSSASDTVQSQRQARLPRPLQMRIQVLGEKSRGLQPNFKSTSINTGWCVRLFLKFALISLSALLFLLTRFGFGLHADCVLLSAFFVSLTLFTGRQSARMLVLELQ
jgi:hypothetical protein